MSAQRILGKYELLELVGGGTWTQVYKARATHSGTTVAIKLMPSDVASHPLARGRFDREVEISQTVHHPFVVQGIEHGEDADGTRWLALEWLEGESLRARLDRKEPLSSSEAHRVAIQLATALVETHAAGWIHRDLTPANVFLTSDRRVKLFDYGMAGHTPSRSGRRLTRIGMSVGTLHYMAPEQLAGAAEQRSDLFALGVLLYEAIAGEHPWPATQPAAYVAALQSASPPRLSLHKQAGATPLALCRLIDRLLERDLNRRPATAADVVAELAIMS